MTAIEKSLRNVALELKRLRNQRAPWSRSNDIETARGLGSSDYESVFISGFHGTLGTSWADLNPWAVTNPWPTSAVSLEALSSLAADGIGLAGARTVTVESLDANFAEQSQDVIMNGVTPVALTGTHTRVNNLFVKTAGTVHALATGANTGTITLRVPGPGAIHSNIQIITGLTGIGRQRQGHYTVPVGKTAFLVDATIEVETSKTVEAILWVKPDADDTAAPFTAKQELFFFEGGSGVVDVTIRSAAGPIVGPTDLWFSAISSAVSSVVSMGIELFLVDS